MHTHKLKQLKHICINWEKYANKAQGYMIKFARWIKDNLNEINQDRSKNRRKILSILINTRSSAKRSSLDNMLSCMLGLAKPEMHDLFEDWASGKIRWDNVIPMMHKRKKGNFVASTEVKLQKMIGEFVSLAFANGFSIYEMYQMVRSAFNRRRFSD